MSKVEALTPAQEAQMSVYRDRWIDIGLDTQDLDQEACKNAVIKMYECGGLKAPSEFVFTQGPKEAIAYLKKRKLIKDVSDYLNNCVFGSHEAGWLSFYSFMKEQVGIKNLEKVAGLVEVAHTCGWVWVSKNVCVLSEKPIAVRFDDQSRLHSETGPAIEYRDGTVVFAWHGVRIPRQWIENKESLKAEEALTWDNMEQRRAMMEIIGWDKILQKLKAKTIDKDEDPEIGELLEVNIPDVGRERFLRVQCGTGRFFAMPVPPTVKTALEANAWTYDIPSDLLKEIEVRT
jgi:hypothetical protein